MVFLDDVDTREVALVEFGSFVLDSDDLDAILTEGCRLIAEALGTPFAKIIQIEPDHNTGLVRAGVGWNDGVVGHERISLSGNTSEAFAINSAEPVITQDVSDETRFTFPQFLIDHRVSAIVNVPIFLPGRVAWGLLQVDDCQPRNFGPVEINFLKAYAMVLGPVIDRLYAVDEREDARAKLVEREARLHRILSRMGEGWAILSPDFTIADFNCEGLRMIGRPGENVIGRSLWDVYPGSDQADVSRVFKQAMEERVAVTIEHEVFVDGRSPIWVEMRAYPNDDGTLAVFWHDVTRRTMDFVALQRNEEKLRSAIEVAGVGLWDVDLLSGTATWSDEFFRMLGHEPGAVEPGYDAGLVHLHGDEQTVEDAKVKACMDAREDYSSEFRVIHPDGALRWLRARGRFFYNAANEPERMLGAAIDITESMELQERQRLLVGELQHRTRNLMSVVRSIAETTGRSSNDFEEFRHKFRDRLDALGRVQGLLSQLGPNERVTFDQLLRTELAALTDEAALRKMDLSGPSGIALRSGSVQALAMALHELGTNALKYGAFKQDEARLQISWAVEQSEGEARPWLVIDWRESGVEMAADGQTQRSGQGRKLIEMGLPYQLAARTTYELGSDGVHCTIAIPLPEKGANRHG